MHDSQASEQALGLREWLPSHRGTPEVTSLAHCWVGGATPLPAWEGGKSRVKDLLHGTGRASC